MLVDTHCHLNLPILNADLEGCLQRAAAAGVDRMIVVGFDVPSSQLAVELADSFPGLLFAAVGVHPHDASGWSAEWRLQIRDLAAAPGVVAVGEIGLDFYRNYAPEPEQDRCFRDQLTLAAEMGLPVIIHCRDAYTETLGILEQELDRSLTGVMHCWSGSPEEAERATECGMYLGFGGAITFKSAEPTRAAAAAAPDQRLLIETDSPYLAPVPLRGKRNEPAYVAHVAEAMAQVRGVSPAHIGSLTTGNAERLFPQLAARARSSNVDAGNSA